MHKPRSGRSRATSVAPIRPTRPPLENAPLDRPHGNCTKMCSLWAQQDQQHSLSTCYSESALPSVSKRKAGWKESPASSARWVTGKANFGFRKETQTLKMMALILIGSVWRGGSVWVKYTSSQRGWWGWRLFLMLTAIKQTCTWHDIKRKSL